MNDEQLRKECATFGSDFMKGSVDQGKKDNMELGHILHAMQQKIKICQTLMFCFMAEIRTEESVVGIYGDMKEMSLEALNILIEHPEIITHFSDMTKGREQQKSSLDTTKLFEELRDAMAKGVVAIK